MKPKFGLKLWLKLQTRFCNLLNYEKINEKTEAVWTQVFSKGLICIKHIAVAVVARSPSLTEAGQGVGAVWGS